MQNSTARKWLVAAGAILAAAAFTPQALWAAGDWTPPFPDPAKEKAKPKTKSKDKDKEGQKGGQKDTQKGSFLNQDQIYSLGYWQAKNGHYATALATLQSARDQNDPRVQTMVGFALRKLGRVDEAFGYYLKAVAIRPNATTTRQYLGEAYLQIGDVARAREQLAEIAQRCGTSCEDYTSLAEEIAKYEGGHI
jgi:tetratricopeptide (TPR) repeat protein